MTEPVATVLVVGATGQAGRVVVATALEHGLQVRALVRDMNRARRLLPGTEVVEGNLTNAATLADAVDGSMRSSSPTAPPAGGEPTNASTSKTRTSSTGWRRWGSTPPPKPTPSALLDNEHMSTSPAKGGPSRVCPDFG
jgi:hypothetical protein